MARGGRVQARAIDVPIVPSSHRVASTGILMFENTDISNVSANRVSRLPRFVAIILAVASAVAGLPGGAR